MDLYADAIGLTRLPDFAWEPYVPQTAPPPAATASPRPAAVEKREAKRQRTLAKRKAEAAVAETPARPDAASPSDSARPRPRLAELESVSRAAHRGGEPRTR
jgi:hypothetical protein